jgi:hypothetical protein
VLPSPTEIRLGLAARNGAGNAGGGHRSYKLPARSGSGAAEVGLGRAIMDCSVMARSPDLPGMPPSAPISVRDRGLSGGADLFHDALDKEVDNLQLAVERLDEGLIRLYPQDKLWQHVVPANDVDPTALRDIELALQLRPEAFIDLAGKPVFDLSVR